MTKPIEAELEALQQRLNGPEFPCTRMKDGHACTQQHEGKFDREGRSVFYFDTGCRIVESFCPACAAYWHVAVARNKVLEHLRFTPKVQGLLPRVP